MSGVADPSEPVLQFVTGTVPICSACLDGEGGECHTPGCILWISRAPDIAIRSMLGHHGCRIDAECPRGLHVVSEADKRVLDACSRLDLRARTDGLVTCYGGLRGVELAEFARRGKKP